MQLLPYIWAAAGLLLIGAEYFLPGLVAVFFGLGALVTAALTSILPGLRASLTLQILLWLASSGLSLYFLRRALSMIFRGPSLPSSESEYAGRTAVVTQAITPREAGRVSFQGASWKAVSRGESFLPGDAVEILKEQNLTFVVTRSLAGNLTDGLSSDRGAVGAE